MYQPTEYQLSAFILVSDRAGLTLTRTLPTSRLKVAIQYSIAKWQAIVNLLKAGTRVQECGAAFTCALCEYCAAKDRPDDVNHCQVCPIGSGCHGTPYYEFYNSHGFKDRLKAAKKELKFLQDLYKERYG